MSLIQRAAERLRQSEQGSLVERAAKRLSVGKSDAPGAAPVAPVAPTGDGGTLPPLERPAVEAMPATPARPAIPIDPVARAEPILPVARRAPIEPAAPVAPRAPAAPDLRATEPAIQPAIEPATDPATEPAAEPAVEEAPTAPPSARAAEPAAALRDEEPGPEAAPETAPETAAEVATTKVAPADPRQKKDVVQIDLVQLQMDGFVTPGGERKRIVEEYRIVKRPLLLKAFAEDQDAIRNGNLIMVTSARPGDGKTFTSINLAMSMASERDLNVLLVDADMHNQVRDRSAMNRLGVRADVGLLDVLQDSKLDLSDVLLRTSVANLSLLPAGHLTASPTELFASHRMGDVVEELAKRYPDRVIIIDTPPVLATSESSVLAMHVGQVVFVVEAEKTSQKAVESSLSLLTGCQNINLVLNRARLESGEDRFGSYAYY